MRSMIGDNTYLIPLLVLNIRPTSVYSSRPSVAGIVVLGGTTRRRSLKPKEPKIEAEGRVRGRVLGEGLTAPPHQLGVWGSAVNSPSGVWDRAPVEIEFWHILA